MEMEQKLLDEKALLRSRIAYGDITKAASRLGIERAGLSEWLRTDADWPRRNAKYLATLKEVVRERETELEAAFAA